MAVRKRITTPAVAPLSPDVVAILLAGWSAKPAGGIESEDDGLFDLFSERDEGIARLFREHEAFLRSEASRLGIRPSWHLGGRELFFGEYVGLPWSERVAFEMAADEGEDSREAVTS
jgi:hypothetical protein